MKIGVCAQQEGYTCTGVTIFGGLKLHISVMKNWWWGFEVRFWVGLENGGNVPRHPGADIVGRNAGEAIGNGTEFLSIPSSIPPIPPIPSSVQIFWAHDVSWPAPRRAVPSQLFPQCQPPVQPAGPVGAVC